MPKTFTIGTYDKKHKENLAKRARKVQQLYDAAIKRIAQAAAPSLFDADPKKEFHFEDFPALKKEMEALMQDIGSSLKANIEDGDQDSWTLSNTKNDAMVDSIIGKKNLPKKVVQGWKHPHLDALNAFIARKEAGMNLSRRVWNLTQQFKSEMELALELGMGEGKSAAALSRDVRKYLVEPNKLFRRVRDKSGALRLSKAAAAYHPGQGVYRSSYKNAIRMTATENNIAYRTADHNRWQALPFVIGIEIHISNNHPTEDICDLFDGKRFPKDFKFTGWHPWCRCYAVSVLASQEEMDAYTTASVVVTDDQFLQYAGTYILTPLPSGLAMIDQHRAHVRILYELYQNELAGHPAPSQRLLFPEMLRVSPSEAVVLDEMLPSMQKIGFDLSPLGGGSYSLLAVPSGTEGLSPVSLLEGILSDAVHGEANPGEAVTHVLALSLARKVAVPNGQDLSAAEMRTMVEQLFACTTPQFTPDGKPTLIVLGNERIESLFGK